MTGSVRPLLLIPVLLAAVGVGAQEPSRPTPSGDVLLDGFRTPPSGARPRVWWHWLSGNVSREGITKDLEWMQRIGIAGAMMFDGDMGAPQIVPQRVTVLSKEWQSNLRFAAEEADRLALEFSMAAAPGWSETGGPWVTPEMGMKKFVWSELRARGERPVGKLPPLPDMPGPFQGIPRYDWGGKREPDGVHLSRDVAVLAFPAPHGDVPLASLVPRVQVNGSAAHASQLVDGDVLGFVALPVPTPLAPTIVAFDFASPQTMRALTYIGPLGGRFSTGPQGRIESSDDGTRWRTLRRIVDQAHNATRQRTFAFTATTAAHFRVVFERAESPTVGPPSLRVAELALVPGARVDLFEDRAGFGVLADADAIHTPGVAAADAVASTRVIDVTDKLRADGTLEWSPPSGDWIILRTGYALTGEKNHPATPEGTGPEVDKFDPQAVRAHLDAYMTPVAQALGGLVGAKGLRYLLTDSWEAGQENWTARMLAEFRARRGYDATRFLPVLAGRVVDNAERSDAFLWDFRRTLADLVAENHYGTITAFAREHGLGYYGEATGAAWPTVADGMQAKSRTDIPMGEFWAMPFGGSPAAFQGAPSMEFPADIIETRSTAHVYGKPLVAAEALTSSLPQWSQTPWKLKWVVDKYLAMGVNRLVLHTSPHQPDDTHKPGLTLGPFSQVFTRHETWGEMARPWIDYLARSSFLLQQGTPVADVLYFYGEGAPSGVPYRDARDPADLREYGFDYVNADALLRLARVENGRIAFPGGASYRLLVLPRGLDRMTLPLITKLRELVVAGAVVAGPKPLASPSLMSDGTAVRAIADAMWPDGSAPRAVGKGRVYRTTDVAAVLRSERVAADFAYDTGATRVNLRFAHRRLADGEIYFVTNQGEQHVSTSIAFRTSGRTPELWDAVSGRTLPAAFRMDHGVTHVDLALSPYASTFVVFRSPTTATASTLEPARERTLATIDGEWTLRFPTDAGTPASITTASRSWTERSEPDIRYFSGAATYERTLDVPAAWLSTGERIVLDLGRIGDVAEVRVNGKVAGTTWAPPYRVDVSAVLAAGSNRLEVVVANTWQNRFVGDLQPGATKHAWTNAPNGGGFTSANELTPDTPLTPSGLLAPVRLVSVRDAARR
jgi:alpha-L-rhamnosidase/Glycosyl hydrolases family 2, sugar binding domain